MKEIGKYFNDTKKVQPRESSNGRCEAYGCPLTGSMAHAVNSPWYCRFHHGYLPNNFDAITVKVKKYLSLIEILDICIRPEAKFGYDYARADNAVKNYLIGKQIPELYVESNSYGTSQKILGFLHDRIKIEAVAG